MDICIYQSYVRCKCLQAFLFYQVFKARVQQEVCRRVRVSDLSRLNILKYLALVNVKQINICFSLIHHDANATRDIYRDVLVIYCKFGNYCVHLLFRSSKIFTDCDFYYCEAWSPPVQMYTYDSEMRGLIIAISHQSHFLQ